MEDNKVTADEARRGAQHDSIKSKVVQDVNAGIAERAEHTTQDEAQEINKVAGQFRGKAIDEVVGTDRELDEREPWRAFRKSSTMSFTSCIPCLPFGLCSP